MKHRQLALGLTLGAVLLLTLLLAACRGGSEEQPTVAPESATDGPDTPVPDTAPESVRDTEAVTEAPGENIAFTTVVNGKAVGWIDPAQYGALLAVKQVYSATVKQNGVLGNILEVT